MPVPQQHVTAALTDGLLLYSRGIWDGGRPAAGSEKLEMCSLLPDLVVMQTLRESFIAPEPQFSCLYNGKKDCLPCFLYRVQVNEYLLNNYYKSSIALSAMI